MALYSLLVIQGLKENALTYIEPASLGKNLALLDKIYAFNLGMTKYLIINTFIERTSAQTSKYSVLFSEPGQRYFCYTRITILVLVLLSAS